MSWNDNIGAVLSPSTTGLTIGYKIENVDGTEYAPFATTNVVESTEVAGSWHTTAAVALPDAGGRIYWGESGGDYLAWTLIPPAPAAAASITALSNQITALGSTAAITVLNGAIGSAVTMRALDSWEFSMTLAGADISPYENVGFIVKSGEHVEDETALLYVRKGATGLVAIGGVAATDNSAGSLTIDSATAFTVVVDITQTGVPPAKYKWWLKGYDTTPTPNLGTTLATGDFTVTAAGLRAIV